jgi:hypothetical protein
MFESYNNLGNNLYLDNIVVSNTTGNEDVVPAFGSFTLYPNPGNGLFTLAASGIEGNILLEVVNAQGQLVYTDHISNHDDLMLRALDISSVPRGVYFVRMTSEEKVQVRKVIIE